MDKIGKNFQKKNLKKNFQKKIEKKFQKRIFKKIKIFFFFFQICGEFSFYWLSLSPTAGRTTNDEQIDEMLESGNLQIFTEGVCTGVVCVFRLGACFGFDGLFLLFTPGWLIIDRNCFFWDISGLDHRGFASGQASPGGCGGAPSGHCETGEQHTGAARHVCRHGPAGGSSSKRTTVTLKSALSLQFASSSFRVLPSVLDVSKNNPV